RASHRGEERTHRTPGGVVASLLVHGQKDLLREVLRLLAGAQDRKCQAVDEFPITVIELTERGRIPRRGAQQLLIRLGRAVGSVGASVQTRFPLAQEEEPTHERRMDYGRTIGMDAGRHGSAGPTPARPMTLARPPPIVPLGCAVPAR